MNDVPNSLKMLNFQLHMQSTSFTCTGQNPSEIEIALNKELENVCRWLTANKLT